MKTFGQILTAAQTCTTKEQAEALIDEEICQVLYQRPELVREQAREIVMHNIGYMTGYLGREEAGRVLNLFGTRHPVFGAIGDWPKTPEETVELGMKIGKQARSSAQ